MILLSPNKQSSAAARRSVCVCVCMCVREPGACTYPSILRAKWRTEEGEVQLLSESCVHFARFARSDRRKIPPARTRSHKKGKSFQFRRCFGRFRHAAGANRFRVRGAGQPSSRQEATMPKSLQKRQLIYYKKVRLYVRNHFDLEINPWKRLVISWLDQRSYKIKDIAATVYRWSLLHLRSTQ